MSISRRRWQEVSAAGSALDLSRTNIEENARNSASEMRKPPLIALAMLRRAIGDEIASLEPPELSRRVHAGVLLKDGKKQGEARNDENQEKSENEDLLQMISGSINQDRLQEAPYTHKYWVDEQLNKSCWMVLAKGLSIAGSSSTLFWKWTEEEEKWYDGNKKLPVAKLRRVRRLQIEGQFKTILLSPMTTYEVSIMVKMSEQSFGWDVPVNLSLALPDGNKQGFMERLDILKKEDWIHISIGKFDTTPRAVGEISFSLTQTDIHWKSGLRVKGVVFSPKRTMVASRW